MLCNISQNAMGQLGGVPISHNALQHFPECHGAVGGGTLPGPAGGGTLAGGVPWPGGYPGWGVPWPGVVPWSGTPPPRPGQDGGGTQLGQHREYLLHGGRYASCVHAGGLSCSVYFHSFSFRYSSFSSGVSRISLKGRQSLKGGGAKLLFD